MKKLLIILTASISLNLMASTTILGCKDQSTEAVYLLRIASDASFILLSPVAKDTTALSASRLMLDLKKDVSNKVESLYVGMNSKKNLIVAEIKNKQIVNGKKAEVNIIFSNDSSTLDQETVLNCSVSVDVNSKN